MFSRKQCPSGYHNVMQQTSRIIAIVMASITLGATIPACFRHGGQANAAVPAPNGLSLELETNLHGKLHVIVTPLKAKVNMPSMGYTYVCDGKTGLVTVFCQRTRTKMASTVNDFEPVGMQFQSIVEGSQYFTIPLDRGHGKVVSIYGVRATSFSPTREFLAEELKVSRAIGNRYRMKSANVVVVQQMPCHKNIYRFMTRILGTPAIDGIPLEFTFVDLKNVFRTRLQLNKLQKTQVADSTFAVPTNYKLVKGLDQLNPDRLEDSDKYFETFGKFIHK